MRSIFILEDGTVFDGELVGAPGERIGEVVLYTGVVGYQEAVTDTTNAGRIIVFTYPLIGNYGINDQASESKKPLIAGCVIKEMSRMYSNWMAQGDLPAFLKKHAVTAVKDVDTRTMAARIRDRGEMYGAISTKDIRPAELLKKIRRFKSEHTADFIRGISTKKVTVIKPPKTKKRIVLYDIGVSASFIDQFRSLDCEIVLVPYSTSAADVLKLKPMGVVVPNGPENDSALDAIAQAIRPLIGALPILAFSTGHLIMALALGLKIRRMRIGHHGVNYPLKKEHTFKGEISVQNHSWVIDQASVKKTRGVTVTETNLNDNSIESIAVKNKHIISIQYYPSSPGFGEPHHALKEFVNTI